jgi:hypothetical protein
MLDNFQHRVHCIDMAGSARRCLLVMVASIAAEATSIDSSLPRDVFQTAFAAGDLFGQTFDGLASGTIVHALTGITFSASLGNPVVTNNFVATTPPNGLGSTSFGYFASTESATISFATPITAFAIDINTFALTSGDYLADLDVGSTVPSRVVYFGESSFGQFFGFTSDTPFSRVIITPTSASGDVRFSYTLDTVIFGDEMNVLSAVPEPSTWVLLGSGLAVLPTLRKWNRRSGSSENKEV